MTSTCGNQYSSSTMNDSMVEEEEMKRDDDLIRKLLLDMEASPQPYYVFPERLSMTVDEQKTLYHLRLLCDAKFLQETGRNGGVFRITNAGHDFLAAIQDENIWGQVKGASGALGQVSLGIMKEMGIGYLRAKAKELGFPLD